MDAVVAQHQQVVGAFAAFVIGQKAWQERPVVAAQGEKSHLAGILEPLEDLHIGIAWHFVAVAEQKKIEVLETGGAERLFNLAFDGRRIL